MADNPRLEITISGDAGTGPSAPQPSPGAPHAPIQPSGPRPFEQPKGRGELNAENVARFASERSDVLEKIKALEAKQQRGKDSGVDADDFDAAGTRKEIERLRRDLETIDDVLRMLGARAEQVAPQIRKAADSLGSDTYRLRPEPAPRTAGTPFTGEPGTYKLGPEPERYNPDAEDQQARERVESIRNAAMQAKAARIAAQEAQTREAKQYRRRRDERYNRYRKFKGGQTRKRFDTAANALQFGGAFMGRGGRYAQFASLALRRGGRMAQTASEAGAGAGGGMQIAGASVSALALGAAGAAVALGLVTAAGYKLNEWMERAVGRYGSFGQQTATERGRILGEGAVRDIARARELDAVLAKYVRASFELDQSWEDFKATLINDFGPVLIEFLNGLREFIDFFNGKTGANGVSEGGPGKEVLVDFGSLLKVELTGGGLINMVRRWMDADFKDKQDKAAKQAQEEAARRANGFLNDFLKLPQHMKGVAIGAIVPAPRPFPHRPRHQHPPHPPRLMPVP
jgi:hypothetical protein